MIFSAHTNDFQTKVALVLFLGTSAVILTVLGFQYIGGYIPCPLCYTQRDPYYAAIPVAAIATLSAWRKWPACLARGAILITGLLMVYAALLGIHHAGVEWKWWEGPASCAASSNTTLDAGSLLNDLATQKIPSCGEAAGRFLGLSFAGWNVVASSVLAVIAFIGGFKKA